MNNSAILFTTASLIDFLSSIEELSEYDIGISETLDGNIQIEIGDSTYLIDTKDASDVEVSEDALQEVDEVNQTAYENLDDKYELSDNEYIEAGLIKETFKTLLIGGLVRLGNKLLKTS